MHIVVASLLLLASLVALAPLVSSTHTFDDKVSQMAQYDANSLMTFSADGAYAINRTALADLLDANAVGSLFNSPSSGSGTAVPPLRWWQEYQDLIFHESSTRGSKIPILFGLDSVHGANYIYNATLFPQQIGMAATFRMQNAWNAGRVAAIETRAAGIPWLFSPILGIAVQPTWARVYETFGEDPLLASIMGRAIISGIQSPAPKEMNLPIGTQMAAACMKHFVGYTNLRTGHDRTPVWIPNNVLLQYFVPPFEAGVDAGVLSVMENYIELNGRPVVASKLVLQSLLRDYLKFKGLLVTDYNEMMNLVDFHHAASTYEDAVYQSINLTSIDMSMISDPVSFPLFVNLVKSNVDKGRISTQRVEESFGRVMALKKTLGLLDGQSPVPRNTTGCIFACDQHRLAAITAAQESITLLKNDNSVLPLSAVSGVNIAVIGQACDSVPLMAGGWTVHWQGTSNRSQFPYGSTIFEELTAQMRTAGANVTYSEGCNVTEQSICDATSLTNAVAAAAVADYVILCVGERHYAEKPGDIDDLTLPGEQLVMVRAVAAVNANVVLVLVEGRPRLLEEVPSLVKAVVHAYLPGPYGGTAVVNVLLGRYNPQGRLPLTYPKTINNAPIQYWRKYSANTGGDYVVQWPFGHGLSYTTFSYGQLAVEQTAAYRFNVSVVVTNVGEYFGSHSILVYATQLARRITPEVQRLVGFGRVEALAPSASATVNIAISDPALLSYVDEYNCEQLEGGEVTFTVGAQSVVIATVDLPSPRCFAPKP